MKRPVAEVITVGTELLTGSVINTNAAHLGRGLTQLGFRVRYQEACGDEEAEIHALLRRALGRSDVIIVGGGLGPTPDDVTREAIASFFRVPLRFSQRQYDEISRHYRLRGRSVPEIVKREAYFPHGAKPILNQFGIALGFMIEKGGRMVVVLPGVPGELTRLFDKRVRRFLEKRFPSLRPPHVLIVKTVGLSEPTVMRRLGRSFFQLGSFQFGIYPEPGEVTMRIYADSRSLLRRLRSRMEKVLRGEIYRFNDGSLESALCEAFASKKSTLAVAESCTGGRVAALLTSVPGASRYFKGSVVAYENWVKTNVLGVPAGILERFGAVSGPCAREMAEGVREKLKASVGLAVTGIAGPTGGSRAKPVGLVYIAMATRDGSEVGEERFSGDREQIQVRATKKALEYLWRMSQRKHFAHSLRFH